MARKVRTHIVSDSMPNARLAPKHLTKQEFGKRLYNLMVTRGWHQSELARQAGLPRDSVSVYIRGRSLPEPENLKRLAAALKVAPEELLSNHTESAIEEDAPAFEVKASPNAPDVAWVRVNRLLTMKSIMQIMQIMEADDAVERVRSGRNVAVQPVESEEVEAEREAPVPAGPTRPRGRR